MAFITIYVTHQNKEEAQRISDQLIAQRHIACANIFPINSLYNWNNSLQNDAEWVSILKTSIQKWETVQQVVEALHPYEVPCIMKFEVEANKAYEDWINASVG